MTAKDAGRTRRNKRTLHDAILALVPTSLGLRCRVSDVSSVSLDLARSKLNRPAFAPRSIPKRLRRKTNWDSPGPFPRRNRDLGR
jgi:hypothetical protein